MSNPRSRSRFHWLVILFGLLTLLAPWRRAGAAEEVPIEQRVVALVFANSMATWTGSGFVVGDGRWVVTNHHVATRKFSPEKYLIVHDAMVLSPWTAEAHHARVMAIDQQADLALLRLDDAVLPSLPLAAADFLDHPPALPRPPVELLGYPDLLDRMGWEAEDAAHRAHTQGLGVTLWRDVTVLVLAPVPGPAKGWSGGPAVWTATGAVVGAFNALVSLPEQPDHWVEQAIGISRLRTFLTSAGVTAATLDRATLPSTPRPAEATAAFRHLMRLTSAGFADEWSTAEREARAFAALRPTSPEAQRILGMTLAGAGKPEAALKALDESRRLAPDVPATLYQRALVLRALGRRSDAEAELRRASEIDPQDFESLLALGRLLLAGKRNAEARDVLRRALKLAPDHPLIHWELGQALLHLGATDEALAEAKTSVDLTVETEPLRPIRLTYARMLAQSGRKDAAETELREAVRLDKENAGTHLALASLLADTGRKEEARREAETALTLKPTDDLRQAATSLLKTLGAASP